VLIGLVALLASCGNSRTSQAVLEQKIDSIKALEVKRQLRMKGIKLDDVSPFQMFYDSLYLQSLPISYSEDYVKYLPDFTVVPMAFVSFLELEGRSKPMAIALPEIDGKTMVLLAADLVDGEYELWLYSLDDDYYPIDKLMLYEPRKIASKKLQQSLPPQETYFSITSDGEIRVLEYASNEDAEGQLSTFVLNDSCQFVEQQPQ
jgi:hypothetical protein